MPKYVATVKLGANDVAVSLRDVETGKVSSITFTGPKESIEELLKIFEENPKIKVKYK